MKRHHKIAIIAIVCGCILAIHQGFFGGRRDEAIINVIVISIVAVATFFKEKIPPQWSFRLGVLASLLCLASLGLYIAPHVTTTPKAIQTETPKAMQIETPKAIQTETPKTLHQEMMDLLTDENFTKRMEEIRKDGRIPEYVSSFSEFQEYLVEQGLLGYKNIDLTNYYQNVFQKYYPGKVPSDLDTNMKQLLITTIQEFGYEKGREEFRNVPENAIWLSARFDPTLDMGEALGKWTEYVLADTFGDRKINDILGGPSHEQMHIVTENPSENLSDKDSRNAFSPPPVDTSDDPVSPRNTDQSGLPEDIQVETIAEIEQTPLELLPPEDFETALQEQLKSENISPERFTRAMQTLNQYGPEEGLRRLKKSDPEVAKQVERLIPKQQENE